MVIKDELQTNKTQFNVRQSAIQILEEFGSMVQFNVEFFSLAFIKKDASVEALVVIVVLDVTAGDDLVHLRCVAHE